MSVEAIGALDADLARANAASQQLAAALGGEHVGGDATPSDLERAHATVQAAEATLARAEAAVQADQAAVGAHHANHAVDVLV